MSEVEKTLSVSCPNIAFVPCHVVCSVRRRHPGFSKKVATPIGVNVSMKTGKCMHSPRVGLAKNILLVAKC